MTCKCLKVLRQTQKKCANKAVTKMRIVQCAIMEAFKEGEYYLTNIAGY